MKTMTWLVWDKALENLQYTVEEHDKFLQVDSLQI